jgi:hypothetical protein
VGKERQETSVGFAFKDVGIFALYIDISGVGRSSRTDGGGSDDDDDDSDNDALVLLYG